MSFLAEILERKRTEVETRRREYAEGDLAAVVAELPLPLGFFDALSFPGAATRIIAEIKRASPSAGDIATELDASEQAIRYDNAGAAAISVLTDGPGFGGSLADLTAVRHTVDIPILRKDFIVDRYQLLEARVCGADAVLLIVAALGYELERFLAAAAGLGLAAVVEVHDENELDIALKAGANIVGINNRDLKTFVVDLTTSECLLAKIPQNIKAIAESGVRTVADAARLRAAGAVNFLVGEALVRASDPGELLRSFEKAS
ncbi:MAG: indole-3-glycerol phosphate synthase TrpC [Deltaproteobacteria bacterium]|nr:indole-3-glycerol phosphate synthase TrpC [Deltaproteobacteria bacterium]